MMKYQRNDKAQKIIVITVSKSLRLGRKVDIYISEVNYARRGILMII